MNIMWMPNRRLGHYGKTNSGVVGDTLPSKWEMANYHNSTHLQGIMVVVFIIYWMYHASPQARSFLELFIAFTFESQPALCESVALAGIIPLSFPRSPALFRV